MQPYIIVTSQTGKFCDVLRPFGLAAGTDLPVAIFSRGGAMSQIADLACPLTCQDKLLTRCHAESACCDACHISDHWEQSKTFGIKIVRYRICQCH